MPIGLLLLFVLAALIFFGLAERVLDRMRLTDTQALIFIGLMIVGSFMEIPLFGDTSLNVGGVLIPLALVVYLLLRAGTPRERWRAVGAAVVTAALVTVVRRFFPGGPHAGAVTLLDPLWFFALLAGVVGYLAGRSRRSAFIAGVGGLILADVYAVLVQGAVTEIGGAGVFDAIVIGGVVAVGLAELIGESRERLQGGPEQGEHRLLALRQDEGIHEAADEQSAYDEGRGDGAGDDGTE